ncbi:MAG TPA: CHRD domain-containing protein [Trebonia sp.]|jgi:hypothetical protein
MTFAHRIKPRAMGVTAIGVAALGVIGVAMAVLPTIGTTAQSAQSAPVADSARLAGTTGTAKPVILRLNLAPMPEGTVTISRGTVSISELGLTPGSSHTVDVVAAGGASTALGTLTASGTGQASATFPVHVSGWSRLQVLDGAAGTEPIAVTAPLGFGSLAGLFAVEDGHPYWGSATVVFNPSAHSVSVTVSAYGLSPGAHAAHIHSGSCASQGPVVYMLPDFTASGAGVVNHETRVATGVTSFDAAGWYLNLHQGDSASILDANGNPTIYFRPLLCADL